MLISINPADDKIIKSYEEDDEQTIYNKIKRSQEAFEEWKKTSFSVRKELLLKAANILRESKRELGTIMTLEMGKPILQSVAEIEKCAWVCDYYADNAENFLKDEVVETDASKSYVSFKPLGVILAVMPWNFPFWQVFRFAAPALMAGNVAVLKHSSNVTGCSLAIQKVFEDAGFPKDVFTSLLISSGKVEAVIQNKNIIAVTLTGSTPAGISVASIAGRNLKKTVLELGGSDPYIILEDADLEITVEACTIGRLLNGGQSCIAAKRFIVVNSIYSDFIELLKRKMGEKKMGDPFNEENYVGPQARKDLRDELHLQVKESIAKGAKAVLGCEIPDIIGAYYYPSILTDVCKGMPAYDEELFGPVAAVIRAKDEKDAIAIANDTLFGLGGAVFTTNLERGECIARNEINAGSCFVNAFVKSDPRLPFGGINESGYGRELSAYGIKEFVNIKTIYIK